MKSLDNIVDSLAKYTDKTADQLRTDAEEALQDDLSDELINRLMEIIELEATIEYDENEDGSFTSVVVDTPNTRELLKDAILDNYRIETK